MNQTFPRGDRGGKLSAGLIPCRFYAGSGQNIMKLVEQSFLPGLFQLMRRVLV